MGTEFWHIVSIIASCLVFGLGVIGYLIKRSVFTEIDTLREDFNSLVLEVRDNMKDLSDSKVGVELCLQVHKNLNDNLAYIKTTLDENAKTLQKMQVDLAVVKTEIKQKALV